MSFTLNEGEALGLVGESGCGKSVSALSLMRLIPQPPGKIVSGEVWFDGRNLLKLKEDDMRKVRGNDIAMIFQDPMTSLNPVLTIGRQISEALELHKGMDRSAARKRTIELLELVGLDFLEGLAVLRSRPGQVAQDLLHRRTALIVRDDQDLDHPVGKGIGQLLPDDLKGWDCSHGARQEGEPGERLPECRRPSPGEFGDGLVLRGGETMCYVRCHAKLPSIQGG